MKNINKVMVAGNVVRDAQSDKVTTFSVAVNTSAKNSDGEWDDYANYFDCVMFGNYGKAMSQYLKKGTKVFIEGTLHQSRWEDKDGNKRSRIEVYVDNMELAPKVASKKPKRSYDDEIPFD